MDVIFRNIDGVNLTECKVVENQFGSVLHMLNINSPDFTKFGEIYFSEVLPQCIKGWKLHKIQKQSFVVPIGQVEVVIYDQREGSGTYNAFNNFMLGRPNSYKLLQIPSGLHYAFRCVGVTPALIANLTDYPHDQSEVINIPLGKIKYEW